MTITDGLWNYILNKFGLALIIECKNYNEPLSENDVVISSKYLGTERITSLGILLTRKGLTKSGEASQINQWKDYKKLILCFTDNDLIKMLEFKVSQDDPGKVLDGHIRKFLESLS